MTKFFLVVFFDPLNCKSNNLKSIKMFSSRAAAAAVASDGAIKNVILMAV